MVETRRTWCPVCQGHGTQMLFHGGGLVPCTCASCGGSGCVLEQTCPDCKGKGGHHPYEPGLFNLTCTTCRGTGSVRVKEAAGG